MRQEFLCRRCLERLDEPWKRGEQIDWGQVGKLVFNGEVTFDFDEETLKTHWEVVSGDPVMICPVCGARADYLTEAGLLPDLPAWYLNELRKEYGLTDTDVQCSLCGQAMIPDGNESACVCGNFIG